jgi:hypothetical protein
LNPEEAPNRASFFYALFKPSLFFTQMITEDPQIRGEPVRREG